MDRVILVFLLAAWAACLVGLMYCALNIRRSVKVYRYRKELIGQIHTASQGDVFLGRDYRWRYNALDSVSFDTMCNRFWRPLDSFYPDRAFVTAGATDPSAKGKVA